MGTTPTRQIHYNGATMHAVHTRLTDIALAIVPDAVDQNGDDA